MWTVWLLGREDFRLLRLELGVGEDSLVLELGQLLELGDRIRCRSRSRGRRWSGLGVLRWRLL